MTEDARYGLKFLAFDDPEAGLLAYAVDGGMIGEADAAPIWARFDEAAAQGAKIRIYAEMAAIPSVSGGMVMAKLKRLGTLLATLDRMAIVGDQGWLDWYERIVDPITRFDIKHFTMEQKSEAVAWLRSDPP